MGKTINLKEAAELIGISSVTLGRWLRSKKPNLLVPHWRSGERGQGGKGDYKFDRDEVLAGIEERKVTLEKLREEEEEEETEEEPEEKI